MAMEKLYMNCDPEIPILGIYSREIPAHCSGEMDKNLPNSTVCNNINLAKIQMNIKSSMKKLWHIYTMGFYIVL